MKRTLCDLEGLPCGVLGIDIAANLSITLDVDLRSTENSQFNGHFFLLPRTIQPVKKGRFDVPLGKSQEEVALTTLGKRGNAVPAGDLPVPRPAVAGDGIAKQFAATVGGDKLRGVGEAADDGDAREAAWRRGAEGAGSRGAGRGRGEAAKEEGGHVDDE